MKKRIIALLLCFITLFSLVSCGDKLPEGSIKASRSLTRAEPPYIPYSSQDWARSITANFSRSRYTGDFLSEEFTSG